MNFIVRNEKTILRQQFFETAVALSLLEFSRGVTCMADGIMTSRLVGEDELAAFGISAPYFSIVAVISILLSVSCQTMYTRNLGVGDPERANAYLFYALIFGTGISLFMTVFGIIFAEPLCVLFGARGNSAYLLPYAKEYMIGLFIGTSGNILLAILHPIIELDGGKVCARIANIVLIVFNIAGNYITTSCMGLGLFGIGISSSLGFLAAAAILSTYFLSKKCRIRFVRSKENRIGFGEFFKLGYPGAVSMLCRAICPVIVNSMIIAVAAEGLPAISAQANIKFVVGAPLCGIAGAVMELGSIAYGEHDTVSLRKIINISLRYIFIGVTVFAAVIFLCAPLISLCYFPSGSVGCSLAAEAIRWYAVSLAFTALDLVIISYYQLIGKIIPLLALYIGNELLGTAVFAVTLGNAAGLSGIFAAIAAGPAAVFAVCAAAFFLSRKRNGKNSLPALPADFGIPEEQCLNITVRTANEVAECSRRIQSFCTEKNIDSKKAFYAAILVEELAGNVIEHGFSGQKKNQRVDLRVAVAGDKVILKIADNGRRFDFSKKAELLRKNDTAPEKYLGLKIALGFANAITYLNVSDKNILVLSV